MDRQKNNCYNPHMHANEFSQIVLICVITNFVMYTKVVIPMQFQSYLCNFSVYNFRVTVHYMKESAIWEKIARQ